MLRTLRRHRLVRDCAEVAADAVLYLAVMLVVLTLLVQGARLAF